MALNNYYADFMAKYLEIDRARIRVIPHGLNFAGHGTRCDDPSGVFTIGYLAWVCPDKGLHNLVAAAELLHEDASLPPFRIRAAGYLSEADRPYWETIQRRVSEWKQPDAFGYLGEVTREQKIAFLQSLNVLSLPTDYHESKGLPVLEALANAVPVVLPDHGTFPELVELTGGGVLHAPGDPPALAARLKELLLDPRRASALGAAGQVVARRDFTRRADGQRDAGFVSPNPVGSLTIPTAAFPGPEAKLGVDGSSWFYRDFDREGVAIGSPTAVDYLVCQNRLFNMARLRSGMMAVASRIMFSRVSSQLSAKDLCDGEEDLRRQSPVVDHVGNLGESV